MKNIEQPNRKKSFLTHVSGAYILTIIAMIKGLFLLPIYFKFISYSMYGYWITILGIIAILSIVNFGIGVMSMQRISNAYAKKDFNSVGDYFINSVILYLAIAFVFLLLGFIISLFLKNILDISSSELEILEIAFYIILFSKAISFLSDSFRGFSVSLLKPLFDVYVMVGANLFGVFLVIVLLYKDVGLLALPISLLATEVIIVIFSGIYVKILYKKFYIKSKIKYIIIKEYFRFSPHFFNLTIGNRILESSHPIIITTFLGAEITSAYDVTKKVIELILTALNNINGALLSPFSHLVGEGNKELISQITIKILILSSLLGIVGFGTYIATNEIFVSLWVGQEMILSQSVIFFLGVSALVFSMNRLLRNLLFGFDEIKYATNSSLIEGVVYILLSIILIRYIGIIALPISFLIASSFVLFSLWNKISGLINIKISYVQVSKFFLIVFFVFLFLLGMQTLLNDIDWINFLFKVTITVFGIIIIELSFCYSFVRQFLNKKQKSILK